MFTVRQDLMPHKTAEFLTMCAVQMQVTARRGQSLIAVAGCLGTSQPNLGVDCRSSSGRRRKGRRLGCDGGFSGAPAGVVQTFAYKSQPRCPAAGSWAATRRGWAQAACKWPLGPCPCEHHNGALQAALQTPRTMGKLTGALTWKFR